MILRNVFVRYLTAGIEAKYNIRSQFGALLRCSKAKVALNMPEVYFDSLKKVLPLCYNRELLAISPNVWNSVKSCSARASPGICRTFIQKSSCLISTHFALAQ